MLILWVIPAFAAIAFALPTIVEEKLGDLQGKTLTAEEREALTEQIKSIRKVKITPLPPGEKSTYQFERNQQSGGGANLFEGDIILTNAQLNKVEGHLSATADDSARRKRQATTVFPKWTDGKVYYYLNEDINDRKKASIKAALAYLQSRTCIEFIKSRTKKNRIRVFNGDGCYSYIGMIGGEQNLSLADGCEVTGTVAHEFTHALGVFHMQSRSDRDSFVTIDTSAVDLEKAGNFKLLNANEMTAFTPYEYGSVMHYGADFFVKNPGLYSIVPTDNNYVHTIGGRQVSYFDIKMINDFYGCSDKCIPETSAQCTNGGTPNPRNCSICNCPAGLGGALCDQRPDGCGAELTATEKWQTKKISLGNKNEENTRDEFSRCNHWVKAPAGAKVQVKVTEMINPVCRYGCSYNGIEIKTNADQRVTNPRYCCPEFNDIELTSELNPTPVVSYNRHYYSTFTIQYRYIGNPTATTAQPERAATTAQPEPAVTTAKPAPAITTATTPSAGCINTRGDDNCAEMVSAGFCTDKKEGFKNIKYQCALACGLCGKAADPCEDRWGPGECEQYYKSSGLCSSQSPLLGELNCAETCGFCTNPV